MSWYVSYRQQWIAEMLHIYGYINREHLVRKFNISIPQASSDLSLYQKNNPDKIEYNKSEKCYETR